MKFESTGELHKELTNIFLLATKDDNFFYYYCKKGEGKKCDLCDLCYYLFDDNNRVDGLPLEKFLQLNYDKREKTRKV